MSGEGVFQERPRSVRARLLTSGLWEVRYMLPGGEEKVELYEDGLFAERFVPIDRPACEMFEKLGREDHGTKASTETEAEPEEAQPLKVPEDSEAWKGSGA